MALNIDQLRNEALSRTNAQRAAAMANQENEYRFNYVVPTVSVPANNVVTPVTLQIGADGDFFLKAITGSFQNATGAGVNSNKTVSVRITDQGRGNLLTDGFCPLWLFLTPGLLTDQLFFPYKFDYIFKRTATILLEFVSSAVAVAPAFENSTVNIVLHGRKVLRYS